MKFPLLKCLYFVLFLAIFSSTVHANEEKRNFTLVIDAGHGGHDAGAVGSFSKEKNINLNVALAFGRLVENNCPDVKVIYTRRTDVFIPLQRRADIANNNKADLFISIHTNALPNGRIAYGSETYSLGMARAGANLAVAKRENSVITLESDYKRTYQGFDPNKAESYVIFEIMQDRYMKQSVDLASCIQRQYTAAGRPNKGVHQAGFLVLRNTSMPSVLTELGFITTPAEEAYLNSQQGISELSRSIYNGFLTYRRMHEKSAHDIPANLPISSQASPSQQQPTIPKQQDLPSTLPVPASSSNEVAVVPVAVVPTAQITKEAGKEKTRPTSATTQKQDTDIAKAAPKPTEKPIAKASPKVEKSKTTTEKSKVSTEKSKTSTDKTKAVAEKKKTEVEKKKTEVTNNKKSVSDKGKATDKKKNANTTSKKTQVSYRIQVGAGKTEISTSDAQFKGLSVIRVKEGSLYKYYYGNYNSHAEAQKALRTVKAKLNGAYIVAYINGKATSVAEAKAKEHESKK